MSRVGLILIPLVVLSAFALAQSKPDAGGAADVVKQFFHALKKDDYPAIARLVKGGKPDYKYQAITTKIPEYGHKYSVETLKILKVEMRDNLATVSIEYMVWSDQGYGQGEKDAKITVEFQGGKWLIVPRVGDDTSGSIVAKLANLVAFPESVLSKYGPMYAETENIDPWARNLGKKRTELLVEAITTNLPEKGFVPPSGYKSMTLVEHTLVLFPAGRADEMLLLMGLENGEYATYWRLVNGRPTRIFQLKIRESRAQKGKGTLAHYFKNQGEQIPGAKKELMVLLDHTRPYAAYIEVGAIGSFLCYTINPDGSVIKSNQGYGVKHVMQDSGQVFQSGFFVTPDEYQLIGNE